MSNCMEMSILIMYMLLLKSMHKKLAKIRKRENIYWNYIK